MTYLSPSLPQSTLMTMQPPPMSINPTSAPGLNTPPPGGGEGSQQLKTGGRVRSRHHKMIAAHFNPEELHVLDQLQGSIERSKKDGRRSYPKLDAVLANPHISGAVHHHSTRHMAHGGHMEPARPQYGMHGDTEIAYIGPHLRHLLDRYAGHKTQNPIDGHPQYFSLSGLFSGLGNAISGGFNKLTGMLPGPVGNFLNQGVNALGGIARTALPGLAETAGNAIGGAFGAPEAGGLIGGLLNQAGGSALNSLGVPQAGQGSQMGESIGQGINTASQMYNQGGYSPQQMFGAGMSSAGRNYGGTAGGAMQGFGNAYGGGQNIQQSALQGLTGGLGSWLQQRQQQQQPQMNFYQQQRMNPFQQQQMPY